MHYERKRKMMDRFYILNTTELFDNRNVSAELYSGVMCFDIKENEKIKFLEQPCYINAFVYLLVLSGSVEVEINHCSQCLVPKTLLLLTAVHLFRVVEYSNDFSATMLLVDSDFPKNTDTPKMLYKRMTYGFKMFNNPILILSANDFEVLHERMQILLRHISYTTHLFYNDLVLNSLEGMYLDLSNIIENSDNVIPHSLNRDDVINSFVQLLVENYKIEHHVDFYAKKLGFSSHYLTKIVKQHTGQTAVDFIYDMLYSEARRLLRQSKLSIQQISEVLNFSDQSAFGKFFKRNSGMSPFDYRKG